MSASCIFCRIAAGELAADVVYQDDLVVAFTDLRPQAPTHLLVIPRLHIEKLVDAGAEHEALLGRVLTVINRLARERGFEDGFRVVVNNGPGGGQTVYHLHFHLLGGRGMKWPPG